MNILSKIDHFAQGWKTFTSTALFTALTITVASKGYDILPLAESTEQAYLALSGAYVALITLFRSAKALRGAS